MRCPHCAKPKSRVLESRPDSTNAVWRQRTCNYCFKSWVTREEVTKDRFPWSEVNSKARAKRRQ